MCLKRKIINTLFIVLPILLMAPTPIPAAEKEAGKEADNETALRVARLSYFDGPVSIQREKDDDWVEAMLNVPLMAGDKIFTGAGGIAELQLDEGVVIHLAQDTFLNLLILDDALGRIEITKGTVAVYARPVKYTRPPLEIKASYFTATVLDTGTARFHVEEKGPAQIAVRKGEIQVYRDPESHFTIHRGEKLVCDKPDPDTYTLDSLDASDDFDRWCDLRYAEMSTSKSKKYVTTRVPGYEDLDRYGEWVSVPDYGYVWRPTVTAVDWAPYHDGRWICREPYGWIWVSYEPWGWVPYHYGRWSYIHRHGWCWVPTDMVRVVHRPAWYPALVSFTCADHGRYFNFSVGGGYYDGPCVGWFPLGPRDPFHPWYHERAFYVDRHTHLGGRYNRPDTNVVVINQTNYIYQNQGVLNAVTVMPRRDLESGNYKRLVATSITTSAPREVKIGSGAAPDLPKPSTEPARRDQGGKTPMSAAAKPDTPALAPSMEPRRQINTKPAMTTANQDTNAKTATPTAVEAQRNKNTGPGVQRDTKPTTASEPALKPERKPESKPAVAESARNESVPGRTSKPTVETKTEPKAVTPANVPTKPAAKSEEKRVPTSPGRAPAAVDSKEAAPSLSPARSNERTRNIRRPAVQEGSIQPRAETPRSESGESTRRQPVFEDRRPSETRSSNSPRSRSENSPARRKPSAEGVTLLKPEREPGPLGTRENRTSINSDLSNRRNPDITVLPPDRVREAMNPDVPYSTPRNSASRQDQYVRASAPSTLDRPARESKVYVIESPRRTSYDSPRSYNPPVNESQPREYSSPVRSSEPREYNPPVRSSGPREYRVPSNSGFSSRREMSAPQSYSAPRFSMPQSFGGGGSAMSAPRAPSNSVTTSPMRSSGGNAMSSSRGATSPRR